MSPNLPQIAIDHLSPFLTLAGLMISILAVGWAGFRWLRGQIRAEFAGKPFREAVRAESIEALRTGEGRAAIREVVGEAISGVAEATNTALGDQRRSAKDQGERIGSLEKWRAGVEASIAQVQEHGRKLSALERVIVRVVGVLQRAGLTSGGETGT